MILIAHVKNARLTGRLHDSGGASPRVEEQLEKARLGMEKDYLTLERASASRPSGEWNDDDFDVLADGVVNRPGFERLLARICEGRRRRGARKRRGSPATAATGTHYTDLI
jgi:hypothetical protein